MVSVAAPVALRISTACVVTGPAATRAMSVTVTAVAPTSWGISHRPHSASVPAVRRQTDHPFVLDENVDSLDLLLRAKADLAMDVVNLKISKLGGLTKTKQARDLCVSMGIAMTLEDSWGGDITTAAIAHLAHSTPEPYRFTSTDFNSYVTVSTAEGAPQRVDGYMEAPNRPGLGFTPRMNVLGPRVVDIH
jgi:L-alanine-DL-glutamate epimerase-like enolase superfamily enzyme